MLKEHSRAQALKVASYASSSASKFMELMNCFMSNDNRLSQRAAWSISWAAIKHPTMLYPHLTTIVLRMLESEASDAIVRNVLRVLEEIEIPEELHGPVMTACFGYAAAPATAPAIKATSLTILFHLTKQYPEIKQELKLLIQANLDNESFAFRSRAKKILPYLNLTSAS